MIPDADALFSVGYTRLGDVGNLVSKYAEQLAVAKAASAEGKPGFNATRDRQAKN